VQITCQCSGQGIALAVSDRGIGMTAEQVALAVQPFQQIDSRLARKYEGAGLGLSIVKGLIERHGGRLEVESRPEVGTKITLIFPADRIRPALATAA
jgi:signal transduction histidine kinase